MIQDTCFRPKPDWVGDVIPWTDQEEIRLYYLLERRRLPKPGTPWSLVVTNDLVHYAEALMPRTSMPIPEVSFRAMMGCSTSSTPRATRIGWPPMAGLSSSSHTPPA